MNWNDFAKEVHQVAVDHGWWDKPVSLDDVICMCICELAEAVEEWRDGKPNYYHLCGPSDGKRLPCVLTTGGDLCEIAQGDPCDHINPKPEGVAVELADCVLRLLDCMAQQGSSVEVDHVYADADFTSFICSVSWQLVCIHQAVNVKDNLVRGHINHAISLIFSWATQNSIDLEAILRAKHEYNKTRPFRHGGKRL